MLSYDIYLKIGQMEESLADVQSRLSKARDMLASLKQFQMRHQQASETFGLTLSAWRSQLSMAQIDEQRVRSFSRLKLSMEKLFEKGRLQLQVRDVEAQAISAKIFSKQYEIYRLEDEESHLRWLVSQLKLDLSQARSAEALDVA